MTMENLISQQQQQLKHYHHQQQSRHLKLQQHNQKQQHKQSNSKQLSLTGRNVIVTNSRSGVIKVVTSSAQPIIHNLMSSSAITKPEKPSSTSASSSLKSNSNVAPNSKVFEVVSPPLTKRCIFGCVANAAALCRFPVHDQKRCNNWLKFFKVNANRVHTHGGLANLRVCLKHFNETQQMAKTRIKTTPTRLQKDAMLLAAATTTTTTTPTTTVTATTTAAVTVTANANAAQALATTTTTTLITNEYADEVKKRLRHPSSLKEPLHTASTIIVAAPKRTNSISSATSTISHASDTQSMHSDTESPPPPPLVRSSVHGVATIPKTLNSLLCKSTVQTASAASASASAAAALKNRKVFMITEKCDNINIKSEYSAAATGGAQKRKMYLIMEESTAQNGDTQSNDTAGIDATKCMKFAENSNAVASKKLTLFADKSDGELSQKFEKILPEILNCIQATKAAPAPAPKQTLQNGAATNVETKILNADAPANNERLPLTLPPKKNRTKIVYTHAAAFTNGHNNNTNNITSNSINNNTNNNSNSSDEHIFYYQPEPQLQSQQQSQKQTKQISAAIPVIVAAPSSSSSLSSSLAIPSSTPSLTSHSNGKSESTVVHLQSQAQLSPQKNINLSTDFLFLMKMLPKLESIPEPHKNHVKNCIERIIMQNSASII